MLLYEFWNCRRINTTMLATICMPTSFLSIGQLLPKLSKILIKILLFITILIFIINYMWNTVEPTSTTDQRLVITQAY